MAPEILYLILGFVAALVLVVILFVLVALKTGRASAVITRGEDGVRIDSNGARWSQAQLKVLAEAVREVGEADREAREGRGRG